jgi:hypothetical protein
MAVKFFVSLSLSFFVIRFHAVEKGNSLYVQSVCLCSKHSIMYGGGGGFIIIIFVFVKRGVLCYYFANQSEGTINLRTFA